jgi:hypothetical protein
VSASDVQAIIERLDRIERALARPADSDPWFTREQAAQYLNLPLRTFDRKRDEHVEALKPCSEHPLRWSRNALDVFKLTKGAPLAPRRGRKPSQT